MVITDYETFIHIEKLPQMSYKVFLKSATNTTELYHRTFVYN